MTLVFALQLALPLIFIAWLAMSPPGNWAGFGILFLVLGAAAAGQTASAWTGRLGDVLGEVGNSGNSGEPHLHVHAQRPGPPGVPLGGDPLPISFDGRFLARGQRIDGASR